MTLPSENQILSGTEAYNRFLAEIWSARQDEIFERALEALDELENDEKRISEVGELRLDFSAPPKLSIETGAGGRQKVRLRAPGEGSWSLSFGARIKLPILGRRRFTAQIEALSLAVAFEVERDSAFSARLVGDPETEPEYRFDFDSEAPFFNFILEVFAEPLLRPRVKREVHEALMDLLPRVEEVRKLAELDLAPEPPAIVVDEVDADKLEERARAIARRVDAEHLPWGAVLSARLAEKDSDAEVAGYAHHQDAAIWTGHYLAAESLRFALTGEQEAAEHVDRALAGLELLSRLTFERGLLSRVAVPAESPEARDLDRDQNDRGHGERLFTAQADGEFYRSIGHISRDQYAGAFLGAGFAALHVDRPELRERARKLVLEMASYLRRRRWCPAEVRLDPSESQRTSTTYAINPNQTLAILRLARELAPETFDAPYRELASAWPALWLFVWLPSLDAHDSYFKFNLEHSLGLLLLGLESDPEEKLRLAQPLGLLRRTLKNHDNAYFNLAELAALGDVPEALSRPRGEIEREVRQQLQLWLERPELWEPSTLAGDGSIETVVYPGLGDAAGETLARRPIAVERRPAADFLWQRSPFRLESVQTIPEEGAIRPPGIDYLFPYWLARHVGVL